MARIDIGSLMALSRRKLVALFAWIGSAPAPSASAAPPPPDPTPESPPPEGPPPDEGDASPAEGFSPMPDARFWAIIDASAKFESDPNRQVAALTSALRALSIDEIIMFEAAFDAKMKLSYSWDLWGADYIIHGGASDDSFEYFRCWLISKGQVYFDTVLADPDRLADLLIEDVEGVLEFEDFAYVAREAWGERAGKDPQEMPDAAWMIYPDREPSGEPFEEDDSHLAARYPRLWARFGESPLGLD